MRYWFQPYQYREIDSVLLYIDAHLCVSLWTPFLCKYVKRQSFLPRLYLVLYINYIYVYIERMFIITSVRLYITYT